MFFPQLPLEVENSFEESFSNCYFTRSDDFSDVEKSGLFGGDLDLLGDSDEGFDENFQSLNSPFDWEMDQEFFKSDVEIGECKSNGPTLAELNGERPLSPLINPEMERLHRVATRTDEEPTGSIVTKIPPRRLFEPKVSLEVYRPQVNRTCDNVKGGKEEETIEFGERFGRVVVKEEAVEKTAEFSPSGSGTATEVMHAPIESQRSGEIQLEKTEKAWISLPQERKIDGKQPSAIPQLVSPEVKSRVFYSPLAQLQGQVPEENKGSVSEECLILSNRNIKLEPEESEDEDMDSDEYDFEDNENEEHGEFSVNRNRKGRRGECDDLVPNPRRLLDIGRELERLNRVIGDLKPIHQLPVNARNKSRKEKNKLASRLV